MHSYLRASIPTHRKFVIGSKFTNISGRKTTVGMKISKYRAKGNCTVFEKQIMAEPTIFADHSQPLLIPFSIEIIFRNPLTYMLRARYLRVPLFRHSILLNIRFFSLFSLQNRMKKLDKWKSKCWHIFEHANNNNTGQVMLV